VCTEFLMVLLEHRKDEVGGGEMGNYIIVHLRNASENESTKGVIICFLDVMCFGVENGIRLRECPFQPFSESKAITLNLQLEAPFLPI
jgi:hypothetical protein